MKENKGKKYQKRRNYVVKCAVCGNSFYASRSTAKYCSASCRRIACNIRNNEDFGSPIIREPVSAKGYINLSQQLKIYKLEVAKLETKIGHQPKLNLNNSNLLKWCVVCTNDKNLVNLNEQWHYIFKKLLSAAITIDATVAKAASKLFESNTSTEHEDGKWYTYTDSFKVSIRAPNISEKRKTYNDNTYRCVTIEVSKKFIDIVPNPKKTLPFTKVLDKDLNLIK